MSPSVLAAFLLASAVLAATPGPGVAYIVTRTLSQGRRAGIESVAGVALGNFGNALVASLGLAALLSISSVAFTLLKLGGAAYLVWLGVKALRAPADAPPASPETPASLGLPPPTHAVRDGFVVALLNPKTALFFVAFLPQFIDPQVSGVAQSVLFGATFVGVAVCTDMLYVLAAAALAPWFQTRPNTRSGVRASARWFTATVYFGLGIFAIVGSVKAKA